MSKKIPRSGPMKRPASVAEGAKALKDEAITVNSHRLDVSEVEFETNEFTSICPRTGQPDFCTVSIKYTPGRFLLESKALKFYLWSFREFPGFTEAVTRRIAQDIWDGISPLELTVRVCQNPRGGLRLTSTVHFSVEMDNRGLDMEVDTEGRGC